MKTCKDCKHMEILKEYDEYDKTGSPTGEKQHDGLCHRFPPHSNGEYTAWSMIKGHSFCGEFKRKSLWR